MYMLNFGVLMKDCLGTHPEMLYTFLELDRRREKRVALSEAKRKRENDLAVDVRQADEDYVWSWWTVRLLPFISSTPA